MSDWDKDNLRVPGVECIDRKEHTPIYTVDESDLHHLLDALSEGGWEAELEEVEADPGYEKTRYKVSGSRDVCNCSPRRSKRKT